MRPTDLSRRDLLKRASIAAAVLPFAALLDGCGGGSSTAAPRATASVGPPLTHAEYQAALDRIMDSHGWPAQRLFGDLVTDGSAAGCKRTMREFADHVRSAVEQVGQLNPPAEAAGMQRAFLDAAPESVRLVSKAADDVDSGDLECGDRVNERIYGLPSTRRAEDAIAALEKLDYYVFGQ